MAHEPIVNKRKLGFLEKVEVGPYQQGVLYKNGRWQRTLKEHETISRTDLSVYGCDFYLLDCRPHTIHWRVDLPAKNRQDQFPLSIEFSYWVQAGEKLIQSGFTNTELLIEHKLKPELRKVSRLYELYQYKEVATAIQEALEETDFFDSYGLQLDISSIDTFLTFSDEELARIGGHIFPKQMQRQTVLPSKDNLYPFEAEAVFKYQVVEKDMSPQMVSNAIDWLWQELLNSARVITAAFSVNELQAAQEKLRDALATRLFDSDGVTVLSAFINLSLGEKARQHAEDLDAITRGTQLDALSDQRRIAHLNRMIAFYERYLPADMRITALGMGDEQVTIREAIERLDTRRQEQLSAQMDMFQNLLKADALPETIQEKAAEALMSALSGYALRGEIYLGGGDEKRFLVDDDEDTETEQATEDGGKDDHTEDSSGTVNGSVADKASVDEAVNDDHEEDKSDTMDDSVTNEAPVDAMNGPEQTP